MTRKSPGVQSLRLRQLLRKLIDIYSPSGKEEEILNFVQGYLKRHGLPVTLQAVNGDRHNLVVIPPDVDVHSVLIGHLDTARAYNLEHFGYEAQGDTVMGLGAADMKGGCAAMIEAYVAYWESGQPKPPVALALVVGEEQDGDGTQKLAKEYHFPWAVIGEPTNLQPCLSHYGYLEVHVQTKGRKTPPAEPDAEVKPIEAMLRLLLRVTRHIETRRSELVFNVREMNSTRTGVASTERCEAWLDLHLPPTAPVGEIMLELEDLLAQEREENPRFKGLLRFATIHGGYALPEKGTMVDAVKSIYGVRSLAWEPQSFRSHSDANLLWASGMKPILLGPGQSEKAHTPEESMSLKQVMAAAEIYFDILTFLSC